MNSIINVIYNKILNINKYQRMILCSDFREILGANLAFIPIYFVCNSLNYYLYDRLFQVKAVMK